MMPSYAQRGGALPPPSLARLRGLVEHLSASFRPSTVYDGESEVASGRRVSRQATARDPWVFDLAENALLGFPGAFPGAVRVLRGHFDVLCYTPGGKFESHRDFEAIGGGGAATLTALLAIVAPLDGGELRLWGGAEGEGDSVTLPYESNSLCLFPARLYHAALPVRRGVKYVLKFDVVALDPLLWLSAGVGGGPSTFLPARLTADVGFLRARADFAARAGGDGQGEADPDLSAGQLSLLARFYTRSHPISPEEYPELREVLEFLSCGAGAFSEEMFTSYLEEGFALVPPLLDVARVAELSPVFFACSYWEGRAGGCAPREWMALDVSSGSAGGGSIGPERWGCVRRLGSGGPAAPARGGTPGAFWVMDALISHEVRQYEAWARDVTSTRSEGPPVVDRFGPDAGWPAPAGAAVVWGAPRARPAPRALPTPATAEKIAAALAALDAAAQVTQHYSYEEECNDGDTYRERAYETIRLRGAFVVLFRPGAAGA
jgi:hypothetical protein